MVGAAVFLVMVVVVVITMITAVRRKKIQTSELSVLAMACIMLFTLVIAHTCIVLHCMATENECDFMQVCYCTEQQALFM